MKINQNWIENPGSSMSNERVNLVPVVQLYVLALLSVEVAQVLLHDNLPAQTNHPVRFKIQGLEYLLIVIRIK